MVYDRWREIDGSNIPDKPYNNREGRVLLQMKSTLHRKRY